MNTLQVGQAVIWGRVVGGRFVRPMAALLRATNGTSAWVDTWDVKLDRVRARRVPLAELQQAADPLPVDWPAALIPTR